MSLNLGIKTNGLNNKQLAALEKSVAGAIQVNEDARKLDKAQATEIQRRGHRLAGDVGQNFGLQSNHHGMGMHGPFDQTYPGSYFFSGQFGGGGLGLGLGLGGGGYSSQYGMYGQGSHTAFQRNTKLAHYKMGVCVSAYKGFGLAKNVIDLMANFAAEGLKIKHPVKTIERFLNKWAFHIDLNGRVKDMLRYYYKYGNVFVYRTLGEIAQTAYLKMRRSRAKVNRGLPGFKPILAGESDTLDDPNESDRIEDAQDENKKPVDKRKIPWRYTLLNPFQMELRGTKFFGKQRWVFVLDSNTVNDINNSRLKTTRPYVDFLDDSEMNLPGEFKKSSEGISSSAPVDEHNDPRVVELDQSKLYTMHYMKDDHEDWAEPLLWPVMSDIGYKNKLRQMDISVCDSVINAVTIYKLGSLKDGFIPPEEHFSKFAEFLRTPTAAMNMVWNDAVSIESSYPPVEKILGMAKYESVDRDILRGIGIPDTLIGGAVKSSFSTGFLGVRTLLERLEEGRNTIIRWLTKELELLVETLGIRNLPTIRFGKMSLRDEKAEKQLIIQLLDRNIVSIEAVLEAFGEDFTIELERLRDEEKIREESGLFQKHSPYVDPINDLDTEEQMKRESDLKMQEQRLTHKLKEKENKDKEKRNDRAPNGRPSGTDGIPQDNKRETKPQGMASVTQWLLDYEAAKTNIAKHINSVEKVVSSEVLKVLGKTTKRALTKGQARAIEDITFIIALQTSPDEEVTSQTVLKVLANPIIDAAAYSIFTGMKRHCTTLQERKIAMANTIASHRLGIPCP